MILKFFFLRELKKYPFFFFLLFLSLFLGTMGLVGINLITSEVQGKLKDNAMELLTSDLAITARRDFLSDEKEQSEKVLKKYNHESYRVTDIYSMVTLDSSKTSRLVEIRATERGFPFYGKITLEEGDFDYSHLYISKDLAEVWEAKVGDVLIVGDQRYTVKGIVKKDSSMGLRGFSLAPRIYMPLSNLEKTGLLKPGAIGGFALHYKFLEKVDPEKVKKEIYKEITEPAIRVSLPEDSSEQTGRVISTITNFMSLAALVGLILSLVGVFYLYQSHLLSRLKDLCLINLHGLSKHKIIFSILGQFSFIFILVVLTEILVTVPLYKALTPAISENLGFELSGEVSYLKILGEIPYLYLLSVMIIVPLLMGLLRTQMGVQLKASKMSMGRFRFWDFAPFIAGLFFFSWYVANSLKVGGLFFVSLMLVFIFSSIFVRISQFLLKKSIGKKGLLLPSIEFGIALKSLSRSGHKLTLSFLSLAMGATLISLILQLDRMILKEFVLSDEKPALFVFDIQEEQMEPLVDLAMKNNSPLTYVTPMIRARLEEVNGKKFERKKQDIKMRSREDDEENRFRNNGLNLTTRDFLTDSERIIKGKPFPKGGSSEGRLPYISLENRWAQRMGIKIGDIMTFDIQGVPFEGQVLNIKEVKWTSFYPNFFITIEPGAIDGAPKTYLATLPAGPKEQKLSLQRKTVEEFPNISFIDVEELIGKLSGLFEKTRKAIEVISWLSVFVGLLILYGLSYDQVYRRYYDLALMKSLGFSSSSLRLNLIYEFGSLFLGAMSVGLTLGWLIAQVIGKEVFKLEMSVDWGRMIYPFLLLSTLCLATIILSSYKALRASPRELLTET